MEKAIEKWSDPSVVVGVGIYPHGRHPGVSARAMAVHAISVALSDAGVSWSDVDFAVGGSFLSGEEPDSLVAELGLTGIQFMNVRNACATGATALWSASAAIRTGAADLAVVVGYDKHPRGAFNLPSAQFGIGDWYGRQGMMLTPQFFAMKTQRYMHDYGITDSSLAKVAAKAYRNGAITPTAFRRTPVSEEMIANAWQISPPLTKYMFCSPDEGAVALVLASQRRAAELTEKPVFLRGVAMRTRPPGSLNVFTTSLPLNDGPAATTFAARGAFAAAGLEPGDVDIAQLQDGEVGAEIMGMAETGLCADGEQEKLIQNGETEITGSLPVNTDGGMIAHGEPVGANGLRQVREIVVQLRNEAGDRQVPDNPKVGLTQVYGAPGVAACAVLAVDPT